MKIMSVLCAATARAMTTGARPFAIAADGAALPTALTAKEWLSEKPGAYTTARTHKGKVFEWSTHLERTASSILEMDPSPAAKLFAEQGGAWYKRRLDGTAAAAIEAYRTETGDADGEVKVTLRVAWEDEWIEVGAHAGALPPPPSKPVRVEARGAPRANAAAKDSRWVTERAPLEALMAASEAGPMNELLLSDGGKLLEGSQTNFYAVKDGALVTAGEGILEGTVRRLALEVCEKEGIPVVFAAPDLADAASWDGCLVSSTSRLLLPVDELYAPAEGAPSTAADLVKTFDTGADSLAARLEALVAAEVEAHSEEVMGQAW